MKKIILFLLFTLNLFTASARVFGVRATLNGANEVPSNASTGTGTLIGQFDDVSGVFNYNITFSSLSGTVTTSHFHEAAAGDNGSIIHTIGAITSPFTGSVVLSLLQPANLFDGKIYVNLHTSAFPDGEIRGQLMVQMEIFDSSSMQNFYAIGGYSYTEGNFPSNSLGSPYVRSGPLPNNDFTFVATSPTGLFGLQGRLTSNSSNQAITLTFPGNNVRKMRAFVRPEDVNGIPQNGAFITATATTNLGNTTPVTIINSVISVAVGFSVINENEYITQVVFSAPSSSTLFTTLDNIMIGDDSPQNVALSFDGVNDHVALPSSVGNFAANASFTVSCWVKPAVLQSDLINTDVAILEKWDGNGIAYPFVIRYLNENIANGANVGKIVAARYNGIANPSIMSSVSIDDNKWHHIAFVVDSGGMKLYIDGVLSASGNDFTPQQTNTPCTNNSPLYVGSRYITNQFFGEIDEIRLWTIGKTTTEIQNEIFCKNPNTNHLQAAYNFSEGVPHGNNSLLTQVNSLVNNTTSAGALNNFAKTGNGSNFVTGQVKYVKADAPFIPQDGKSWATAHKNLQLALNSNTCNDLFEVYVAAGTYIPSTLNNDRISFNIPSGMKIYGGFQGYENSLNERNKTLIHTTNKTTLSGDLAGDDIAFDFSTNRLDNSFDVVIIKGVNVYFDGFTVRSGFTNGLKTDPFIDVKISDCQVIDNKSGITIFGANSTVANCTVVGNNINGINVNNSSANFENCLIANNGNAGIYQITTNTQSSNFTNCTISSNAESGIKSEVNSGLITNTIQNTIIKDNGSGGILNIGSVTNNITYSLVQGETSTANGNLNGNTTNPQFVSPLANTIISDAGNYRLKWCSLAINAGNNTGISPLDLDRNPRNFNTTADMGAYEFLGNIPSQVSNSTITGTIDSPTYAGGAIQTITSTAKVLAPAGAIDFKAPNAIILNPGFEARGVGKYFQAQIGANRTCMN